MDRRTLYLFDVRSPEEYEAGHLHSTVNAPGDQLVQTTDAFAATPNARICLLDDNGVRATMTASWLLQMGWREVYVVRDALASGPLYKGAAPLEVLGLDRIDVPTASPAAVQKLIAAGDTVVVSTPPAPSAPWQSAHDREAGCAGSPNEDATRSGSPVLAVAV